MDDRCRLYTFVDTAYLHGRAVDEVARQLCDGGSGLIQLRAKDVSEDEVRRMAERILPVTDPAGVKLVINDYPKVAIECGAWGCHLGQEDFFDGGYKHSSDVMGTSGAQLGLSTHEPEQAKRALEADPEYIAIGPVYATGTKPSAAPVTLDYVRWASAEVKSPWFAIGGINLETLDEVMEAGARRVAVVSAILNAPDVMQACQEFADRLSSAPLD